MSAAVLLDTKKRGGTQRRQSPDCVLPAISHTHTGRELDARVANQKDAVTIHANTDENQRTDRFGCGVGGEIQRHFFRSEAVYFVLVFKIDSL
jgi:hypothetical protein